MLDWVYVNGEYLRREDARFHVSDLSILRGYGVFDYFRYVNGKPRFLADHLARIRHSAAALHLDLGLGDAELTTLVHQLIERNGGQDGGIRLVLTGGYAPDGYTPVTANLAGLPYGYTPPAAEWYAGGCTVWLHPYERQLPTVKTIDYLEGIRIQPRLRAAGAQYPLYVDRDDYVRESDRSNYFIVRDGTLITPGVDILAGITRLHLLRVAQVLGISTEERRISTTELWQADEVIICSSIKGAMPVSKAIDSRTGEVANFGLPGPVTRRLMEAWKDYGG